MIIPSSIYLDARQENWVNYIKSRLTDKLPEEKKKQRKQTRFSFIVWLVSFGIFSFYKFLQQLFFSCAMGLHKNNSSKR